MLGSAQTRRVLRSSGASEQQAQAQGCADYALEGGTADHHQTGIVYQVLHIADLPPRASAERDAQNTPPTHALARRGIVNNVRGYLIYGDYRTANPPEAIVDAVDKGDVDVAVVWGPLAGYFAQQRGGLDITPVQPAFDGPQWPMVFNIAMGVRRGEPGFKAEIDAALSAESAKIARFWPRSRALGRGQRLVRYAANTDIGPPSCTVTTGSPHAPSQTGMVRSARWTSPPAPSRPKLLGGRAGHCRQLVLTPAFKPDEFVPAERQCGPFHWIRLHLFPSSSGADGLRRHKPAPLTCFVIYFLKGPVTSREG